MFIKGVNMDSLEPKPVSHLRIGDIVLLYCSLEDERGYTTCPRNGYVLADLSGYVFLLSNVIFD